MTLAAGVAGLLSATAVQAGPKIPAGSYQQSCTNIAINAELALTAKCAPINKDPGAFTQGTLPLNLYYECVGDISNNDARLECQRNPNSGRIQAANAGINYARQVILGLPSSAGDRLMGMRMLFQRGMDTSFFQMWNRDAVAKAYADDLGEPANGALRGQVIERAYQYVLGYSPPSDRAAFWDARLREGKGIGYINIVGEESTRLNASEIARKMTLLRVYKAGMGRNPDKGDQDYWVPRKETYQQMLDANRAWLYSARGAKDPTDTVRRALENKYAKTNVSDNDIKVAMAKYTEGKRIFDEM